MKVLVAEDEDNVLVLLEEMVKSWGHEVRSARNGKDALDIVDGGFSPDIAILDWLMPSVDGVGVCQGLREREATSLTYVIMLTVKARTDDVVAGLDAGADDYIPKPFDRRELQARVKVGVRLLELQNTLSSRVRELEEALAKVKQLQKLLPICSYCKKIRDDHNYWQAVDEYLSEHSEAVFSHGICPECYERIVKRREGMIPRSSS